MRSVSAGSEAGELFARPLSATDTAVSLLKVVAACDIEYLQPRPHEPAGAFAVRPLGKIMSKTPDQPRITEKELSTFRRCRFVHRVFRPRDSYRSLEPPADFMEFLNEWQARGDDFFEDPTRFEVIEGGWDHEHCDVCWARIEDGDTYWPNEDEEAGQVDLCEKCYPRVMELLRAEGGPASDRPP